MKISEAQARILYIDYHCNNNSKNTTPEEMGEITSMYADKIASWQNSVTDDENQYDFDDRDYSKFIEKGREEGEEATGGFQRKDNAGNIAGVTQSAVTSIAGAVGNVAAGAIAKKISTKACEKVAKTSMKEGGTIGQGAQNISAYVAIAIGIITAAAYWIKNPNKKAVNACNDLQNPMMNAQGALSDSQEEMAYMADELVALSDEASQYNEEANEEIEEKKSEYDMYMETFKTLQEKIDSGEPLTEEEKALYKEIVGYINETGIIIEEIQEDTTDIVGEVYDDMGTYQDGYDYAAETMAEAEGLTNYAQSFDSQTRVLCYVEGGAQTLNAASTGIAAARLAATSGIAWWNYIIVAAGLAAAASSGVSAGQQFKWAGEVGNEIEMRKGTQDLNAETSDIYDVEIDNYDALLTGVEDLEVEMPNDVSEVQESTPENTEPNKNTSNGYVDYTEILEEDLESPTIVKENGQSNSKVVLSKQYATAICQALNLPEISEGPKFNENLVPAIISKLMPGYGEETIRKILNGNSVETSYEASLIQTTTGEDTGEDTNIDNSKTSTKKLEQIVNFYAPIFKHAAQNGWKC